MHSSSSLYYSHQVSSCMSEMPSKTVCNDLSRMVFKSWRTVFSLNIETPRGLCLGIIKG